MSKPDSDVSSSKPSWSLRSRPSVDWLVLSVALVSVAFIGATTWERVKTEKPRTMSVTGSATKRITSDLIQWHATIEVEEPDLATGYRTLKRHVDDTVAYLVANGIDAKEIQVSSASSREQYETVVALEGEERIERTVSAGFALEQDIKVASHDVDAVERVSREVTALLEREVPIVSYPPKYIYTKLGELKIEMLSAAAEDARERAERIVAAAGGAGIKELVGADMGVININPPNSRSSSWDGNNDTSSLQKDIITIVHASFELEN